MTLYPGTRKMLRGFNPINSPGHFPQSLETYGFLSELVRIAQPPSTSRRVESGRDVSAKLMCIYMAEQPV
jgi:hypothetical protein